MPPSQTLNSVQRIGPDPLDMSIEQHVPDAPAHDHAQHAVEQQVAKALATPGRRPRGCAGSPGPARGEAEQVHQAVPVDLQRPQGERDRVHLVQVDHACGESVQEGFRDRGRRLFCPSGAAVAQTAGITKASVHYHFPTKEDLVTVLVQHYLERFVTTLEAIRQRNPKPGPRLREYALLFLDGYEQGMLPLCGALSAERLALPASMHRTIHEFFPLHLEWLTGVIEEGLATSELRASIAPGRAALLLLSTLEGGTFVGWALQDKGTVLAAFEAAMRDLELSPQRPETSRPS